MKLLFDQNLSPRLVNRLADLYPDSAHVHPLGLGDEDDRTVWDYAKQHRYLIVTKDSDFGELVVLLGFPPKVVWIRRGNCATQAIEQILRENYAVIEQLVANEETGIVALF